MRHWWSRALPWAVVLVLTSWQTSHAFGSLLQEFTSATQVDFLSCSDPTTCTLHSTNATSETFQESLNHFTIRFGLNVNADEVVFGPGQVENGIAEFITNFTIAPGNYDLTITAHRTGALRRSADALFCGGSVALGDMGAPTFTVNGMADDRLSGFVFPGTSIADAGGDADATVPADAQSQVLLFRGRTLPDQFSLTFFMNAAAFSHSCEVSARLGAPNLSTQDCDSCGYPGSPARTIEDDGLFVEVNIENKCGDGATQFPEQCDLANLNGDPSSCCNFDCTFKEQGRVCRPAAGPCDQAESCSGTDRACPPDLKAPAGTMCPNDGDFCTLDQCDDAGQCAHTLSPVLCPGLFCGNGQLDQGEDCDLGRGNNGTDGNCCGSNCKIRLPAEVCRPAADPCDQADVCNGENQSCPDLKAAAGTSCPDDGDFCTADTCDASGQCVHTLSPLLCPNLFCGNGQVDPGEDCDVKSNDSNGSCCGTDCKFSPQGAVCRQASSPCDQAEVCPGSSRLCPPDLHAQAGTPCPDDGDFCTEDSCNASGQCVHTLSPVLCPALLCGNGQLDAGEDCDLGKLLNGASSNCCDASCKFRPNNSGCDDGLFCNGIESCTNGVCGGSPGTRCGRACEICDEASNLCDASHCPPPPPLPLQPTRELLIGEIFDGDGDRFDTSAGGSVRGTLDLDANGDLRFTAADLLRLPRCADDAALVGAVCIDKYEASVFGNPPGGTSFGERFGQTGMDYPCNPDGGNCRGGIFARSLHGSTPSRFITWFQAQQACANVGKRLLTNAEWQMAVAGTPDTGANDDGAAPCNTSSGGSVVQAGSRPDCVSKWGIFDMVGNVWEWVAEWMPASSACPGWGAFSDDFMCLAGASQTETNPGAQIRGGGVGTAAGAGPFAIINFSPSTSNPTIGFRCARAPF